MPGGPDRGSAGLRLLGLASGRPQALACQCHLSWALAFKPASASTARARAAGGGIGWCWLPAAQRLPAQAAAASAPSIAGDAPSSISVAYVASAGHKDGSIRASRIAPARKRRQHPEVWTLGVSKKQCGPMSPMAASSSVKLCTMFVATTAAGASLPSLPSFLARCLLCQALPLVTSDENLCTHPLLRCHAVFVRFVLLSELPVFFKLFVRRLRHSPVRDCARFCRVGGLNRCPPVGLLRSRLRAPFAACLGVVTTIRRHLLRAHLIRFLSFLRRRVPSIDLCLLAL